LYLTADIFGEGRPVVLLHGGGQTRHAWGGTAQRIAAAGWQAIAVDQRGHGTSDWAPDGQGYRLGCYAEDVAALLETLPEPAVLVGASMGGLAALMAASGLAPHRCRALVLVDVAVSHEPEGVDRILGFMSAHEKGFADLDEAAAAIARYLPHRRPVRRTDGLAKILRRRSDGRYYWHWDPQFLAASLEQSPEQWRLRLREAAKRLRQPTLLVRGGLSDVLSDAGVQEFLELVPHARYVSVRDAAHMVAGDDNDRFTAAVLDFLDSLPGADGVARS
jgi:pimeloyl-ACP methyl ester carboxylesterase